MTPKEAQGKFNQEFQHRLKTTPFPDEYLPKGNECRYGTLDFWKLNALQTESPISLAMTFDEWKVFVEKDKGYTMFEAAQLFNLIERKTPKALNYVDLDFPNYVLLQQEIYQAGLKWQELTNPIREAIDKKIEIMANNIGGQMRPTRLIKA